MTLDPRMTETLPPRIVEMPKRADLRRRINVAIRRDEKAIAFLAREFIARGYLAIKDLPPASAVTALYLHAEALRRAADLIDETLRMAEGSKAKRN